MTGAAGAAPAMPAQSADLRRSFQAYLVLMLYLVAVKVTLLLAAASSPGFRSPSQAAVFSWPWLAGLTGFGLGAVWLCHRLGLPGVWSQDIPLRRRLWLPGVAGLAMGGVSIAVDLATGWSAESAQRMGIPSIHIPFPNSLLIYPGGAVVVDVLYYLVPIPLLVWLGSQVVRERRHRELLFWVAGALAAAIEPLTQASAVPHRELMVAAFTTQDYVLNLAQVYAFKRAGFGAAVVFRVAFYLVWHVLYGLL